jgi:hypothetical protein
VDGHPARRRAVSVADRAIRVSTAAVVVGVAGIAAYVSYWHAYEVVRAHGENGVTARLEPATIDGLVYASSMVVLYAARHRLGVPALARWLLALGIVATLGANVAHGWHAGPIGAAVAAWPAASLVGSYELLLWLVRSAADVSVGRDPAADQPGPQLGRARSGLRLVPPGDWTGPAAADGGQAGSGSAPDRAAGSEGAGPDQRSLALWSAADDSVVTALAEARDLDAAAVAAYLSSLEIGRPLSERRLAAMFGKTSRRWARHRMAEARHAAGSRAPGSPAEAGSGRRPGMSEAGASLP